METEQPLYYHMHVETTIFFNSICCQLVICSSNKSALFILIYRETATHIFIIDPSLFTYDSALSFLVICVQCYIGPYGVLVPTGTVHSNSEFEFEFIQFMCINM